MLLPRTCCLLAGTVFYVLLPRMGWGRTVKEQSESRRLRLRRAADAVTGDEGRIANGVEATPHEFPSFLYAQGFCPLSLIRRRWGLTAGHCIPGGRNVSNASEWAVIAGKHNNSVVEEGQQMGNIIQMFRHPGYDELAKQNDIGLVKFEKPFKLSATVQPVELAPGDYKGLDCLWIVGTIAHCVVNVTEPSCDHPKVHGYVMKVDVPIMSDEKCEEYLVGTSFNRSTKFCAGYDEGGKGHCSGDSGGPLFLVKDGKQIQVGIVSSAKGCVLPKLPGIYTRVAAYVDWIEETIRNEEALDPTPDP